MKKIILQVSHYPKAKFGAHLCYEWYFPERKRKKRRVYYEEDYA